MLCADRRPLHEVLVIQYAAASPKTRVQRTFSLGLAIGLVIAVGIACDHKTPTEPREGSLAGTWVAALVRSPCLSGDWSSITVTLQQAGDSVSGTLKTKDGQQF